MNKVILMGRLTRDPEVRYGGASNMAIARFSIAVDRRFKRDGEPTADFFNCTAFGKTGEFVEKYLHKGTKIVLDGEIRNDNYTNKNGEKVYGFQIVANNIEFAESKNASQEYNAQNGGGQAAPQPGNAPAKPDDGAGVDDFMNIPEGIENELPFH